MPTNFLNHNSLLLKLIFFALLWKEATTPTNILEAHSPESNELLAKRFSPPCPMSPINKPLGSMMYVDGRSNTTAVDPKSMLKENFEFSFEAEKIREKHIANLRRLAIEASKTLQSSFLKSIPYLRLRASLSDRFTTESDVTKQQTNDYIVFLIATHAFANTAQRVQAGNCHEFSRVTLAQCHRYFFERKLPMPNVGALHFFDMKKPEAGHVAAVFGIGPEKNNATFHRNSLVKLLREVDAVVADHWNKNAIVLADDICQKNSDVVHSPTLRSEGEFASYAKAFYNSFCDEVRYETFPPLPHFANLANQNAFDACIQYILDATRIATCAPDEALQAEIAPKR